MSEIFTVKASDLVLRVSENVDPTKFDISKYDSFLRNAWERGMWKTESWS